MEPSCGQMAPVMKDSGPTTKLTDRVSWSMLMVTSTRASGSMTKPRDMEPTRTPMEHTTRVNGSTISSMEEVLSRGQMVHATKDSMRMARRRAMGD